MKKANVNKWYEFRRKLEHLLRFNNRRNRMLMRAIIMDRFSNQKWFVPTVKGTVYPVRLRGEARKQWEKALHEGR